MKEACLVFVGGGLGSIIRFFFTRWFVPLFGVFPLSTFLANLIACSIFGVITGISFQKIEIDESLKKLILTGFCGGLSTFSTFNAELFNMVKSEQFILAFAYLLLSVMVCFSTFWFAIEVSK